MKVAMTGASGAGKTTLVKFISEQFGLRHISGSAGDIKTEEDKRMLYTVFGHPPNMGHLEVIKHSALYPDFGYSLQNINQQRRQEIIENYYSFVTDRSPLDNLTYFISQIGFHPQIDDKKTKLFAYKCLTAWNQLSHVIYIKAVVPDKVEVNGSRVSNMWYQKASDAQFEYWLKNFFIPNTITSGPKVLTIDYWDLGLRKKNIIKFLN